jgi:subtilisin family serine protease
MKISALTLTFVAALPAAISAFGPSLANHGSSSLNRIPSTIGSPSSLFLADPPLIMVGDDTDEVVSPTVQSSSAPPDAIQPHAEGDTGGSKDLTNVRLPGGVLLTGGMKLREEGLTGKGIKVAVIDSGVDADHPGFNGQVKKRTWYRYGSSLRQDDHGTHVAGTIHMMAPEADIYDYRVFGARGYNVNSAIVAAIERAIDDGCQIINMSLGASAEDRRISRAVEKAYKAGVIMIGAAGNSGDNDPLTNEPGYPAMNEEVVSVAAVAKRERLPVAYFSNSNSAVDYSGIGVDVISFRAESDGYIIMQGTSMAAPHVCGFVTALMTEGGAYSDRIKDDASLRKLIDEEFLKDIGVKGPDNETGLGFLTYLTNAEYSDIWE